MRTSNHRRRIHRDCWPFSGRFLSGRSPPAARESVGREQRTPPPRGDALPVGHPPAKPPDDYRGNGRGPGFDGPADYGGRGPGFDGPADYGRRGPGFDGLADYGGRGKGPNLTPDYGEAGDKLFTRPETG
ncbi:Hypp8010 [Branchiostoma lanceolatum]|uniref:Hypp8010 protein n=1 Tax=Branchiostoma lanceolatum TaxID=7740 RepID=A0A8J9Z5P5_BRALA|nr:Hypp8010 [Branchiostoma lanceolatum]